MLDFECSFFSSNLISEIFILGKINQCVAMAYPYHQRNMAFFDRKIKYFYKLYPRSMKENRRMMRLEQINRAV